MVSRPAGRARRACLVAWAAILAVGAASPPAEPVVAIAQGKLRGSTVGEGVERFADIPFAAPPTGERRWRAPVPPAGWDGVRDATALGVACPQPVRPLAVAGGVADRQSEDCLQLNIWRPKGARRLPVMVWLHGGANVIGSGTFPVFDGTALARGGVIVVTINYRLGLLGFFAHPALTRDAPAAAAIGNFGTMDQLAALRWVRANIARFGGDPRRVTLFGESAGAIGVTTLLTVPAARGLFARAIVQSGLPLVEPPALAAQEQRGSDIAQRLGLPADVSAAGLRAVPADRWVAALGPRSGGTVMPFVDGRFIRRAPWRAIAAGDISDVPLLIGTNSDEAGVLLAMGVPPERALAQAAGGVPAAGAPYGGNATEPGIFREMLADAYFGAPARWLARHTARGAPTFLYRFDYVPAARREAQAGAPHGAEVPFVFGTLPQLAKVAGPIGDEDTAFASALSECWLAFAIKGRPDCALVPGWPAFSGVGEPTGLLGPHAGVVRDYRKVQFDYILARGPQGQSLP